MAKTPSAKAANNKAATAEIDTSPEAWERFRQAVKKVAKSGPKHREAEKPPEKTK